MAELLFRWKLDDGIGLRAEDSGDAKLGNDGQLIQVGGFPHWIDGKYGKALRFNGAAYEQHNSPRVWMPDGTKNYCGVPEPTSPGDDPTGFTMMCLVRTTGDYVRPIFHLCDYVQGETGSYPYFTHGFYQCDGYFYFGVVHTSGSTGLKYAIKSDTILNDGQWHLLVGRVLHYNQADYDPEWFDDFWVDGKKQVLQGGNNLPYQVGQLGSHVLIGMGALNVPGSTPWQDTGKHEPYTKGTINGDIDECRVYCGYLSEPEIIEITGDFIRPQLKRRMPAFFSSMWTPPSPLETEMPRGGLTLTGYPPNTSFPFESYIVNRGDLRLTGYPPGSKRRGRTKNLMFSCNT